MADVARAHGGDGGNQPPDRHPSRLPTSCESSKGDGKRGKGANKKLLEKYKKNGNKPLRVGVYHDGRHVSFVGTNQSDFKRCISNTIYDQFPMHFRDWNKVPQKYMDNLWGLLNNYFNFVEHDKVDDDGEHVWPRVEASIIKVCQNAYRGRKYTLGQHFLDNNGETNPEEAKKHPPEGFGDQRWKDCIDHLFTDPEYIKQCKANKENRKRHKYPSCHGSQSYTQKRWLDANDGNDPDCVEGFKDTHMKDGEWVNEEAHDDYARLSLEKDKLKKTVGVGNFSDQEVFKGVFGQSRGHQKGIGSLIRRPASDIPSGSSSSSSSMSNWQEQLKAELQQKMQEQMQEQLQQQLLQQQQMQEWMTKMSQDFEQKLNEAKKEWQMSQAPSDSDDESGD